MALLKDLKALQDIDVKYIHFNNVGDNEAFERLCKDEGMCVKFMYTMPCTPQQSRRVKWKIVTMCNKVQSMLNGGKFSCFLRSDLWAKAAKSAMPWKMISLQKPAV